MYNNCNVIKVKCVSEKRSIGLHVLVFYWVWPNITKILFIKNTAHASWSTSILRPYMYLIHVSSKCHTAILDKVCHMLELRVLTPYSVTHRTWNTCYYYWWVGGCWNYIYISFLLEKLSVLSLSITWWSNVTIFTVSKSLIRSSENTAPVNSGFGTSTTIIIII